MDSTQIAMVVEGITLVGGGVAAWNKMSNELTMLRSRIRTLEKSDSMTQEKLEALLQGINEIKLLLARKQLD